MLLKLGAYAADVGTGPLPVEIQHAAKQRCVDWFATTVPGSVVAPATLLREALAEDIDRGGARLIPDGALATTRTAAYINAAASHTVEFDDIYGPGVYHPGVSVISAALAIAEDRQVSGLLFLKAIVAGYEISNRIGAALQPAHYRYWHTTGTVGTFGAAAAASVILGLNATETAHALANSATFSAGLKRAFLADSMSKPLHAAHAAESGLTAALAAAKRPGLHPVHTVACLSAKLPAAHFTHSLWPLLEVINPGAHVSQSGLPVDMPNLPASQERH